MAKGLDGMDKVEGSGWRGKRFQNTVLASMAGSCLAISVQNPIMIVKVHMQKVRIDRQEIAVAQGVRQTIRGIYETAGPRGFWAGLPMGLMQSVPSTVTFMLMYEATKEKLGELLGANSVLRPAIPGLGGAIARSCTVALVTPIELIRTLQASGVGKSSSWLARDLYQQRGVGGFYLGLRATLMRDVPYTFIYWQAYQAMKDRVLPRGVEDAGSMATVFAAGAVASSAAAVFTHPFDVLKTNQQVNVRRLTQQMPVPASTSASASASTSTAAHATAAAHKHVCLPCNSVLDLYRRGGTRALFRGLTMRLAMVIPGSAIMISVYELVRTLTD
jgi:solute carrier family 25 protein 39/40